MIVSLHFVFRSHQEEIHFTLPRGGRAREECQQQERNCYKGPGREHPEDISDHSSQGQLATARGAGDIPERGADVRGDERRRRRSLEEHPRKM